MDDVYKCDTDEAGEWTAHIECDWHAAAEYAKRRDMDRLAIRMAVVRSLHATWTPHHAESQQILWHYGSRAIAGDY